MRREDLNRDLTQKRSALFGIIRYLDSSPSLLECHYWFWRVSVSVRSLSPFLQEDFVQERSAAMFFVLDEAHGLHLGSQNMSTRILREGRKFGISGWFITQWADDIKMLNTLSQAALRIFFRPGTENIKSLAKALAHGNLKSALQYRQMIAGMRVGDFFFFNTSGNAVYVKNTDTNQIQEGGNYNGL